MGQPHKHAAAIKAWADGEEIQVNSLGYWENMGDNQFPKWDGYQYRVKPKNITVARRVSFDTLNQITRTFYSSDPNSEYTFDPEGKLLDVKVLK